MTATLVTSPSAAVRLQRAWAWLQERAADEPLLVVATSVEAATALCVEVFRQQGESGSCFGWTRITLGRLAVELASAELADRCLTPAGTLAVEGVVTRVVHRLLEENRLGRYTPVAEAPGLAQALAATIGELRLAGVGFHQLSPVDADLARVLAGYEEQLAAWRLTDRAGVLPLATRVAEADAAGHRLLRQPLLLLDLPVRSAAEGTLVAALARRSPQVLATVPAGDERSLEQLQQRLGAAPELLRLDSEKQSGGENRRNLGRLQVRLFAGGERTRDEVSPPDSSLEVVSAPDMSRECMEIMRRLCAHARQGIPFDRMAVLLRSPEEYRPYLEEAFTRAGVPVHFARGVVRPDAAGRAFLALLHCAWEGLSAHRFAEYLSLAQVPQPAADGQPPPACRRWTAPDEELALRRVSEHLQRLGEGDEHLPEDEQTADPDTATAVAGTLRGPRRWEQLLVDAAVIGGRERWQRRLDGLQAELQLDLQELEDEAGPEAERCRRDLQDLHHLRTYALPLIGDLDHLPAAATWGEWLEHLQALATRALREPERVLAVLAGLEPLQEVGPVDLAEVCRVLARHLLELRLQPSGHRWGRVWVGPLEAARGASFAVVFLPGLAERLFPRPIAEDPVLLDAPRRLLDRSLVCNPERVGEERLALRLGVGAADSQVVLSWPRLDLDQGRPRVPSFYVLEAVRAGEGRLPGYTDLARRADVTQDRIGWPAPQRPEEAVDNAEYDLALLHDLVDRPPEQTRGAAHYLLSANEHLARALRCRGRRWLKSWTTADGLVQPGEQARAALARHRLTERSYSPTALQHYAACPYRFFLYAVLRLTPREEVLPIDEMDALQRGSLVHEVQYELLTRLRDRGLLPITHERLDTLREHLDTVLAEVAAKYREQLAPAIERVWQVGVAAVRADLCEWLRRCTEDDSGFQPWRFELSFGLSERRLRDAHSRPDAVPLESGILLRGSVDLVERRHDGALRVTDHKTGKARVAREAVVAGGEALQPVLYALAVEQMHPGVRVTAGRLYYCTVAGGYEAREVPLDITARRAAEQVAAAVDGALANGFLPAAPREGACRYCDYQLVCGSQEERRMLRKPAADLAALNRLRELP